MRRGKEFYSQHYEEALKLFASGKSVQEISNTLQVSYSCVYQWVRGVRKPETGNLERFHVFLQNRGPIAEIDVKETFPKHNELYLIAARRGLPVRRKTLGRKYGEYSVWYFLDGQEGLLQERVDALFETIRSVKQRLRDSFKG